MPGSVTSPFLWIGLTLAILSESGYIPVAIDELNSLAIISDIKGAHNLINLLESLSWPDDFFNSSFEIKSCTSCAFVCLRYLDWLADVSKYHRNNY